MSSLHRPPLCSSRAPRCRRCSAAPRDEHHDHLRGGAADPGTAVSSTAAICSATTTHLRHVFDGPFGDRLPRASSPRRWASRFSPSAYLGTRQVNLRQQAHGEGARRPRRHQDAHAGRAGMAAARPHPRRQPGADGHAGGLPRAQDRHHRRAGKSAVDLQRGEILRGDRAGRADRPHAAAGVLQHRIAGVEQADRRAAEGAQGRRGAQAAQGQRRGPARR